MTDVCGPSHLDGVSGAAKAAGITETEAEKIIAAYFASRGWAAQSPEPLAYLVWLQAYNGTDDVHDYFEVARPGDKCVDGSPPFPVWGIPINTSPKKSAANSKIQGRSRVSDSEFYYAEGLKVWKSPVFKEVECESQSIADGFPLCTVSEYIGEEGAEAIAELLNAGASAEQQSRELKAKVSELLGNIDRKAEAGLCYFTLESVRAFLQDIRQLVAEHQVRIEGDTEQSGKASE
jgi:hypothetical protein